MFINVTPYPFAQSVKELDVDCFSNHRRWNVERTWASKESAMDIASLFFFGKGT